MASLISQALLSNIITEPTFYLNKISARCVFENGKRTTEIIGFVHLVTNVNSYQQISVLVEQIIPIITPEELELLQVSGKKVYVQFDNAIVKPYYSERTKSIEDSIKATDVHLVETKK